ncbi:hypothetical protein [Dyadobacter sp. NIV53]|uniref:hypothetical protein n=1 Tax=Dyadobacter sp. NIV53 TaxID=2861765 RepID=UPI001C87ED06|nr:hypothetical protein [Dyadobacter sp. NIV53]
MFSCSKYSQLQPEKIVSIRPVFKDTTYYHPYGYRIGKDIVKQDNSNLFVKENLSEHLNHLVSYENEINPERITKLFSNKKTTKYRPIKVVGLREFGYIQTMDQKVIFYGIMGKRSFIDLSSNQVYLHNMFLTV